MSRLERRKPGSCCQEKTGFVRVNNTTTPTNHRHLQLTSSRLLLSLIIFFSILLALFCCSVESSSVLSGDERQSLIQDARRDFLRYFDYENDFWQRLDGKEVRKVTTEKEERKSKETPVEETQETVRQDQGEEEESKREKMAEGSEQEEVKQQEEQKDEENNQDQNQERDEEKDEDEEDEVVTDGAGPVVYQLPIEARKIVKRLSSKCVPASRQTIEEGVLHHITFAPSMKGIEPCKINCGFNSESKTVFPRDKNVRKHELACCAKALYCHPPPSTANAKQLEKYQMQVSRALYGTSKLLSIVNDIEGWELSDLRFHKAINASILVLNELMRRNTTDEEGIILLGSVLWQMGRPAETINRLTEVINNAPTRKLFFTVATYYFALKKMNYAMEALKAGATWEPAHGGEYIAEAAHLQLAADNHTKAKLILLKGIDKYPRCATLHRYLSTVYTKLGEKKISFIELQKAYELDPDSLTIEHLAILGDKARLAEVVQEPLWELSTKYYQEAIRRIWVNLTELGFDPSTEPSYLTYPKPKASKSAGKIYFHGRTKGPGLRKMIAEDDRRLSIPNQLVNVKELEDKVLARSELFHSSLYLMSSMYWSIADNQGKMQRTREWNHYRQEALRYRGYRTLPRLTEYVQGRVGTCDWVEEPELGSVVQDVDLLFPAFGQHGPPDPLGILRYQLYSQQQQAFIIGYWANYTEEATLASMPYTLKQNLSRAYSQWKEEQQEWQERKRQANGAEIALTRKLRICYISVDFGRGAPVLPLVEPILQSGHTLLQFDTFIYYISPHRFSPGAGAEDAGELDAVWIIWRSILNSKVVTFRSMTKKNETELAQQILEDKIDILVDLNIYMKHELHALRAAPVQISFLGRPMPSGSRNIDYIIADKTLIPDYMVKYYSEKILYMPEAGWPSAHKQLYRSVVTLPPTVEDLQSEGLPSDGSQVILANFNQLWKLDSKATETWFRVMKRVPNTVLWFLEFSLGGNINLTRATMNERAQRFGISPSRIIWGKERGGSREEYEEHAKRFRYASLFLDSFNYGMGSTAVHVLWSGVPLITLPGDAYYSRMAASLVNALTMKANPPEIGEEVRNQMIANNAEEYEEIIYQLASNPEKLKRLRRQVEELRTTSPLFNLGRYRKHLENAYRTTFQRHLDGLPPDDIQIPAIEE